MTTFLDTAPVDHFDTEVLQQYWIPVARDDVDTAAVLRERLGIDFAAARGQVDDSDGFRYLPVAAIYERAETVERETIVFALSSEFLVTLQPSEHFLPFDRAIEKMSGNTTLARSAHGVMYALFWALNEASSRVVHHASTELDAIRHTIETRSRTRDRPGGRIAVADLHSVVSRMNALEHIAARTQQTQLHLARGARHLQAALGARGELHDLIGTLVAEIEEVRQRAVLEHGTICYLQQSVITELAATQSRVVELVTVVVATILPLTVVIACHWATWAWIPESSWQHRSLATALMTLAVGAIPAVYLQWKRRHRIVAARD
ncbi:CorA family divalent cation transporter [Nocardia sp. CNY236]|uniref:CorA family divalent cation transporter n=1 Tax=Nocardia sp. CNY236 TaxID=1169152 RepID=UPI000407364A|nr:CorA family divalent cation transporter [Nocardia sp. CNY236]